MSKKSIILLGPRQTGKSTLLRSVFPDALYYNLLHTDVFFRLQREPSLLRGEVSVLKNPERIIIIDEIQKLPILLDEVQSLIDSQNYRFILTGSSARKLKSGGINLLGGRARLRHLYPFVSNELPGFDLEKALTYGLLPSIWFSDSPEEDLNVYCGLYLKEEIQAEALVRRLDGFSRFLSVAGMSSAKELNFEKIARDCGVPARTVREYVSVLTDTLIASVLEPWKQGKSRKSVASVKLYFFDLGVARVLAGRPKPTVDSTEWGLSLEQFIYQELKAWLSYSGDGRPLCYWRTQDSREVDFIVGNELAIEVKASKNLTRDDFKNLRDIADENNWQQRIVVCREPSPRLTDDGILVLPVASFLERLWAHEWERTL